MHKPFNWVINYLIPSLTLETHIQVSDAIEEYQFHLSKNDKKFTLKEEDMLREYGVATKLEQQLRMLNIRDDSHKPKEE